eukprot:1487126-Rhodomonas_salina.1
MAVFFFGKDDDAERQEEEEGKGLHGAVSLLRESSLSSGVQKVESGNDWEGTASLVQGAQSQWAE